MRTIRSVAAWCTLVVSLYSLGPQMARAAAGDEHWSPQFGLAGTPNLSSVQTLGWHNGRLYASGVTTGVTTNCALMVFDGYQWSKVADFNGTVVQILSMAFVGDDLYVGGLFNSVNGVAARSVARWNGTTWSDMGLNGYALALAANGTDLYAAGVFTGAGSVMMTNIARWDGSAWHAMGDGLGTTGDYARAIAFGNGNVYVGGAFTVSGSQPITNLAVWNGASWSAVGGGVTGASSKVNALAWQGNGLYVGGAFTAAGGTAITNIARWDSNGWSALGSGLNGTASTMAFLNGTLCVGGSFTSAGGVAATNYAIWSGLGWSGAGLGLSSSAACSVATGTNIYVGGNFFAANGAIANYVASWDGSRWSVVGTPGMMQGVNSSVRALAYDGRKLYAGGFFTFTGSTNATRVGCFDGTNWSSLGTGLNNIVRALALVGTNLYAGGDFTGGAGGPSTSHLARWNGVNWVALTNFSSTVINALATRGNDLYLAGYFGYNAVDGHADWVARWDGTNMWNVLVYDENTLHLFYIDNVGFTALAVDGPNVYVSGHCSVTGCDPLFVNCTNSQNVMWFDGTYVRGLGTGLSSNANAIAVMGTNVYFGGVFTNAGGATAKGIACWNGLKWSEVGGGIVGSGSVNALAVMGTNLYAGGSFTNMGGVPANRIARWNGTTWAALGSGTSNGTLSAPVFSLTAAGDDLYVGGTFTAAGGKPAYYLARWNEKLDFSNVVLRLSQLGTAADGHCKFTLTSVGVPVYVIDASTNLIQWSPVVTNTTTPYDYTDPNAPPSPRRFFKARSLP